MNIAFDIDGVVLNSIDDILQHINKKTNKNISYKDLKKWDLDALGVDRNTIFDAVKYMCSRKYIQPYGNAEDVLLKIYKKTRKPLLFITGRKNLKTASKQLNELNWNSIIPEMIITGGKRNKIDELKKHNVEFILEDDDRHAKEYLDNGIKTLLLERPWNKHTKQPIEKMFKSWEEFYTWYKENNEGK